mmetsp:Transcript_43841/g.135353  ORF Transcript_43841/g.135353 Transcript_43841/m.135353 type:complete len:237 (-) Transcript_43841:3751-4461(-)
MRRDVVATVMRQAVDALAFLHCLGPPRLPAEGYNKGAAVGVVAVARGLTQGVVSQPRLRRSRTRARCQVALHCHGDDRWHEASKLMTEHEQQNATAAETRSLPRGCARPRVPWCRSWCLVVSTCQRRVWRSKPFPLVVRCGATRVTQLSCCWRRRDWHSQTWKRRGGVVENQPKRISCCWGEYRHEKRRWCNREGRRANHARRPRGEQATVEEETRWRRAPHTQVPIPSSQEIGAR